MTLNSLLITKKTSLPNFKAKVTKRSFLSVNLSVRYVCYPVNIVHLSLISKQATIYIIAINNINYYELLFIYYNVFLRFQTLKV